MADFSLRPESYTACGVFGGIGAAHFQRAHEEGGGMAILHGLVGLLEILPFIGWMIAFIEWCVAASGKTPPPQSSAAGGSAASQGRAVASPLKPATANSASVQKPQAHSLVSGEQPIPTPKPTATELSVAGPASGNGPQAQPSPQSDERPTPTPPTGANNATGSSSAAPAAAVVPASSAEVVDSAITVEQAADKFLAEIRKQVEPLYPKELEKLRELSAGSDKDYQEGQEMSTIARVYRGEAITAQGWQNIAATFEEMQKNQQYFPLMTIPLKSWSGSSPAQQDCFVLDIASLGGSPAVKDCTIIVFLAFVTTSTLEGNTGYIVVDAQGKLLCDRNLNFLLYEPHKNWVDEGETFNNPGGDWDIRFLKQQPAAAAAASSSSSSSSSAL